MSLTLELIAVLHVRLPVAGLPLDVERETRRASHRRQSGHTDLGGFVAPRMSFLHRTIFPDLVGARDRSDGREEKGEKENEEISSSPNSKGSVNGPTDRPAA